ncbi:hypothetical protein [Paenibacillus psychroresistens]|nr:hypothetical protein [Paenibacillus psychroresistens]
MNHELVNNRISQLPIAMAGIVHVFMGKWSSLSNKAYTVSPFAK